MSEKQTKLLRKQIRNVVQDLLPGILQAELVTSVQKDVSKSLELRLDAISNHIKESLEKIDTRTKEVQDYVVRSATAGTPVLAVEDNTPKST